MTATAQYRLGPVAELPAGEGRVYVAGSATVAVFRLRDGSLRAVSAACPHAGGPIADGLCDTEVVICPLHQHVFELATGCSRTGQRPLRVYPVRVENDQIIVEGTTAGSVAEPSGSVHVYHVDVDTAEREA